ncbi:MAG: hypothetical protein ACJ788_15480 [Ktedonobacteraceae bacterium]
MANNSQDNMDRNGLEEPEDDLAIEITDLDEVAAGQGSTRFPRLFTVPWFISHKYQKPVTIATTAFIVLALLIILLSTTPLRLLFMQALPASEQATFSVRLEANPPWGRLLVDGKSVALISRGASLLFSVPGGQHRLTWSAAPFAAQECVISLPPGSGTDTCKHPDYEPDDQRDVRASIFFSANLSLLSPEQRAALILATQTALDSRQSSEIVRTGELYAFTSEMPGSNRQSCTALQMAALCFSKADQPLTAKLIVQLDTDTSRKDDCSLGACEVNGQNCHLLCDLSAFGYLMSVSNRSVWQPFGVVHVFWHFATMDGQVIAANEPDTFILGMQNEHMLHLNIRWNGKQWDVTTNKKSVYVANNDPVCDAAYGDLYTLVFASMSPDSGLQLLQETATASGCLIKISLQSGAPAALTPVSAPPTVAYVLQRFGVLLAVNASAHRLWPFLPLADAYAQNIAQQLMTRDNTQ